MRQMMRHYLSLLLLFAIASFLPVFAQGIELPSTRKGVPEQVIRHTGFTTSYNDQWRIPNWVAWELTREETTGSVGRSQQFVADPDVKGKSASTYDYSKSGYDRGHMAPAGDMKWSQQAMDESFYLTNICPQHHDINAGQWEKLENRCRGWAKFHGRVWISCGPVMSVNPATIGENKVAVPSGFFKVVCTERRGQYHAIGFLFPNNPCQGSIWEYAMSVDEVEEVVGHDFFHNLPDAIEAVVERSWNEKFWKSN